MEVETRLEEEECVCTQVDFTTIVFGDRVSVTQKLSGIRFNVLTGEDIPYLAVIFALRQQFEHYLTGKGYHIDREDALFRDDAEIGHSASAIVKLFDGFRFRFIPSKNRYLISIDSVLIIRPQISLAKLIADCRNGTANASFLERLKWQWVVFNLPSGIPHEHYPCRHGAELGKLIGRVLRFVEKNSDSYPDAYSRATTQYADCNVLSGIVAESKGEPIVVLRTNKNDIYVPSSLLYPEPRPEAMTALLRSAYGLNVDIVKLQRIHTFLDSERGGRRKDSSAQRFFRLQQILEDICPAEIKLDGVSFNLSPSLVPVTMAEEI